MKMSSKRLISLFLVLAMTAALLCAGVYADPVEETDPAATDAVVTEPTTEEPAPVAEEPTTEEPAAEEPAAPEQPATVPVSADPRTDGQKVLTIIGDSIAAGYGLSENTDSLVNQFTLHGNTIVEGSYPQILRDEGGFDVVYKDARESYTAINFLRMIDEEYDKELAQPKNYYLRWLSECTFFLPKLFGGLDDTATLKANIKNHIATSDAIVINLGNNDTFTMALLDFFLRSEYYVYGMAAQPALSALKGQLNAATSLEDLLAMFGGTYGDIFTKEEEYLQLFKQNMDRMIGVIRRLNPTAEIYYMGMYNTFEYALPEDDSIRQFLYDAGVDLCNKLEHYAKNECAYRNEIHYVDVLGTEVWKSDSIYSPSYWLRFLVHCHPDYVGHRFMAEQLMAAMAQNSGGGSDANCPLLKFIDLLPTAWYHETIDYVLNRGIMQGMTDNLFGPETTLTRAMVVTMLYAMDGKPEVSSASTFSDVRATDWFVNPVIWAAQKGIVSGYEDGTFRPSNAVTREELATMLRSYAAYKSRDISPSGNLSVFADSAVVSQWATENVAWAVGHGIINGRDGNLIAPRGTATRAEAATMFTRLCQNVL